MMRTTPQMMITGIMTVVVMRALAALAVGIPDAAPHPAAELTGVDQTVPPPEAVWIKRGDVTLGALLWRPAGRGPFPAVLVNHGSGRTREDLAQLGAYENQAETIGPVFARHGYAVLFLFRHGVGPSTAAGKTAVDLLNEESAAHGESGRNALQLRLLEGRDMDDALAGLAYLRQLSTVDSRRIALVGHSFGGSLTVLMAAREPSLRAAVVFSAAGYSWDRSPELRARLLEAIGHTSIPFFFLHAANDYSTNLGKALDAELEHLGKPHRLKIYPPVGRTPDDGHDFPMNSVATWEPDVFAFLDPIMRGSK
jgi:dienelactone hydrolase